MITEKSVIRCESVFSDDKAYRYLLAKTWDKSKPAATVISISPSGFYNVESDNTTMLIQNNLSKLGFGGMELVNLLAGINVDAKRLKSIAEEVGDENDSFIVESVKKTAFTVLAWGKISNVNKLFEIREKEVLELLEPYTDKIKVISDCTGRECLHPLTPSVRNEWFLCPFKAD